jgi:DNA primase
VWLALGRTLDPEGVPKYLNSPQTPLFDKGLSSTTLTCPKRHIREARQVVLVEVHGCDAGVSARFPHVVAQMGTSRRNALRLLQRLTATKAGARPDAAGQGDAAQPATGAETLDREMEVTFDARV